VSVLGLLVFGTASAGAQPTAHVRAMDAVAAQALSRGLEESAAFRALVETLDASDVIVHVVAWPALPMGLRGSMLFVARVAETRYVRVDLASLTPADQRVASLAHELHHACELARSAAATQDAVRALYRTIGKQVPGTINAFETDLAERTAAQVWSEIRRGARAANTSS
jgi:hypothetical protein